MTIFWRTFLSFWIAMVLILGIVLSNNVPVLMHRAQGPSYHPVTATLSLADALAAYESHGPAAFSQQVETIPGIGPNLLLYDAHGTALSESQDREAAWSALARECALTHTAVVRRKAVRVGLAAPVTSASGRSYVVVFLATKPIGLRIMRTEFWAKLAVAMIPVSLICLGLSMYISRPIRNLQATVRRVAAGNVSDDAPTTQSRRRDEVGQLSRDVDGMARRIRDLLAAQKRFVSDVSHELSAPITRLQLASALLERDMPQTASPALTQMEREIDRLSELVQELLFLASLENAVMPAESFKRLSLDWLCEEVLRDNAAELEECSCQTTSHFVPVTVEAASQSLRRAIENVFRNAVRYCPPHSHIVFRCGPGKEPGMACVEISDSGEGVPEAMLTTIFQPFVRAVPSKAGKEGTGLGLAIAAEAVALHRGSIQAENRPEGGLRVTLTLPVARNG